MRDWRTAAWHLRHGGSPQYREWRRRIKADARNACQEPRPRTDDPRFAPMDMPEFEPIERPKPYADLRVAVIMDDFSLHAWSHEFDVVAVEPERWRSQLSGGIDLLFVESAWNGNGAAWQYHLTGTNAPSTALQELVAHCREQGIPTAFWNKEDPPHYEDFLETAKLFEVVLTSDSRLVPRYRDALGHERVETMSFAAQPAIHNPIRDPRVHQRGDVAFAGMYFAHKFPERREQMDLLLGAAQQISARTNSQLTVYSRFEGGDPRYRFPTQFSGNVVGSLPYSRMLSAYRAFKVFLNVNSVVDSPSMCARRVFEITASGTPVLSGKSAAIPLFFAHHEVPTVDESRDAELTLRALVQSPQLRDRMVHRAQRRIWNEHTYTHRAKQLFALAGVAVKADPVRTPSITVICSTNRPEQIAHLLSQVGRQRGVDVHLALLTHGFEISASRLADDALRHGVDVCATLSGPSGWSLGECLNALVDVADGELIAKFDDDDVYGPNYLLDQANALRYSGADIVGKQASYLYLAAQDAIVLRNPTREHRWTTFVAGPTFVAPRATFAAVPFEARDRGEDSAFLRTLAEADARIYSADRFGFMQVRGATSHTWQVNDIELMANGTVESFGRNDAHAMAD